MCTMLTYVGYWTRVSWINTFLVLTMVKDQAKGVFVSVYRLYNLDCS
jgi:hypothetical protein